MKKIKKDPDLCCVDHCLFPSGDNGVSKAGVCLDYSESPDYRDVLIWIYEGTKRRNDHRLFLWTFKRYTRWKSAWILCADLYADRIWQRIFPESIL